MKKIIVLLLFIASLVVADSTKHRFVFTLTAEDLTLLEAAELEKDLQKLLDDYDDVKISITIPYVQSYSNPFFVPNKFNYDLSMEAKDVKH